MRFVWTLIFQTVIQKTLKYHYFTTKSVITFVPVPGTVYFWNRFPKVLPLITDTIRRDNPPADTAIGHTFHLTWAMPRHANRLAWPWLFLYSVDEIWIFCLSNVCGGNVAKTAHVFTIWSSTWNGVRLTWNGVWFHPITSGAMLKLVVCTNKLYL